MQLSWLVQGLRTGIVSTRYPAAPEVQPAGWRGRPVLDPGACRAPDGCAACVTACLPQALRLEPPADAAAATPEGEASESSPALVLDYGRCIMCGLCVPVCPVGALRMQPDYELAVLAAEDLRVTLRWERGAAAGAPPAPAGVG
jgi:formate hydrogenlyase subunit 6/NADH:ubiquinone oxidoreductase subunit I